MIHWQLLVVFTSKVMIFKGGDKVCYYIYVRTSAIKLVPHPRIVASTCARSMADSTEEKKAYKQTKPAEVEREWRNRKESQRRWCQTVTYRTAATYGKRQSPWNWKTKVPAGDNHYWLASFGKPYCRLLASHIIYVVSNVRATLHAHVRTLTQLATRGFWVKLHLVIWKV